MYQNFQAFLQNELNGIKEAGLYKNERIIVSPQSGEITLQNGQKALNFCANNYLGLANNPKLIAAAKEALDTHGYGMASVRFIGFCGLLCIVFIILKLCHVIAWSWLWVLAPLWIPLAIAFIILLAVYICSKLWG